MMRIPTGLPTTPRWPCGHVRAVHVAEPFLDTQCRACWLRLSDGPGHDDAFAYDHYGGWSAGYYDRWDARDAERNTYRGREAKANGWEHMPTIDALDDRQRGVHERRERTVGLTWRIDHQWAQPAALAWRLERGPYLVTPTFDPETRACARPYLNPIQASRYVPELFRTIDSVSGLLGSFRDGA